MPLEIVVCNVCELEFASTKHPYALVKKERPQCFGKKGEKCGYRDTRFRDNK